MSPVAADSQAQHTEGAGPLAEKRLAAAIRVGLERALHPWFRYRALAQVRRVPAIRSVYFICTGNIYRSPFAAVCFTAALPAHIAQLIRVGSGGFTGTGRTVPPEAVAAAERYGVDLRTHRSDYVNRALQQHWDLIVAVERRHVSLLRSLRARTSGIVLLGDLDPNRAARRNIADPYGQPVRCLEECYARVHRCAAALAGVVVSGETRT